MEDNTDVEKRIRQELSRKVALAAEVAKDAPGFESLAFQRILDHLLATEAPEARLDRKLRPAKTTARRTSASAAESDRIAHVLQANAETISEAMTWLEELDQRNKLYGILRITRDTFNVDGLTIPELRAIANGRFRLGIPDGTLRGTLSRAPQSEVGKEQNPEGETLYRLMRPGDEALDAAIAKGRVHATESRQADPRQSSP
jgi:hypothetical protein